MPAAPIVIRVPRPDELEAVVDLWHRSLDGSLHFLRPEQRHHPEVERAFFRNVVATRGTVHVADREHPLLGVLAMLGDEVDRLYIAPEAQRTGIGSALIDHAKALSPSGLRLVTLQRNQPARSFYERHGFSPFAYGRSPAPESEPDVWYQWRP